MGPGASSINILHMYLFLYCIVLRKPCKQKLSQGGSNWLWQTLQLTMAHNQLWLENVNKIGPWSLYHKFFYSHNCCHIASSPAVLVCKYKTRVEVNGCAKHCSLLWYIINYSCKNVIKMGPGACSINILHPSICFCKQILDQGGSDLLWQTLQLIINYDRKNVYNIGPSKGVGRSRRCPSRTRSRSYRRRDICPNSDISTSSIRTCCYYKKITVVSN